ncbi:coiled-coil alpha-helical rod protein 1 isoform X4 [Manis pentadactyla]|uniref:coiled-coil alpha-helical rod protein 1 isoform X4 n=1 Tax=Manis pentadactyla TaxID=143292 RepID=UPI00255CE6D4|nr:coiled-coil alpha-helical rod protein 1 isoform X4 [Manis pentadactyla]
MFRPSGSTGLIPPSHFQAHPLPTLPRMAPSWVSDIPLVQPSVHQDGSERWADNRRPQAIKWEQDVSGDEKGPGRRGRSMELHGSQALNQQAELISRQLQELRRFEDEVRVLRETSLQQKMRLEAQAMELEALAWAEKAGRSEAEGLRAALAGAELVRKNLEEGNQRELEEVQRLHQEQLSSLTKTHQEALYSLTNKAEGLEKSLNSLETRRAGEAKELAMAQKEAELLRKELSKTQEDLKAQVTLVENLRRYVGEQVPLEIHSQTWESERQELLENVQHLQEAREGLRTTVELLQVRVQSLLHILAMQEEELARKVQPSDSLELEFTRKCQALLKQWREKVFALMVQLKAQELEHRGHVQQLKGQLTELQERTAAQSQERAILQRSLQDKAAEVEVERMGAKALQMELSRAQEARQRQEQHSAMTEGHLKLVASAVSSFQTWLQDTAAEVEQAAARLPSLSSRVSYAVRKVYTIRGLMARKLALAQLRQESCPLPPPAMDVSLELEQLREERNRLDAELQLSAHLIQQEVGRARQQALQEKVAEVETRLREQLSETERRLSEARREQAKAVVSLRQIQRKATREKERSQELRRLQEEAWKEEGLRLTQRLQDLERDKDVMLATLQQEGLLSHYKQQRLLAVLPSLLDKGKSVEPSLRPSGSPASLLPAMAPSSRESIKGSLSVLLDDLQDLSEAISKEEAISQGDNQNSPATVCQ